MICQLPIIFFFCPFSILQYKSLSYREVCAIRAIRALKALRADRAPRGFQLHEEVPFPWSSQTDPVMVQPPFPVRACLRPGTYHVLVLTELQWICGTGAQGDGSLLNALSRKCYMCTLQYVHRGTLP